MFNELFTLETYNDGSNTVNVVFRKLYAEYPTQGEPQIIVIFDEIHTGAAGNYTVPFTVITSNSVDQIPVFNLVGEDLIPVMIEPAPELVEGDEGYFTPYQKKIGGFDVWRKLLFEAAKMPINLAFEGVVKRQKGLTTEPMIFIE